jgi:hypothetical protein
MELAGEIGPSEKVTANAAASIAANPPSLFYRSSAAQKLAVPTYPTQAIV